MILLNVERTKAIGNAKNVIFVRKVARGRNSHNCVSVMMLVNVNCYKFASNDLDLHVEGQEQL